MTGLAVISVPVLAFAGIPLLTRSSKHFVETGESSSSLQLHWALYLVAATLVIGIVVALYPRRNHPG